MGKDESDIQTVSPPSETAGEIIDIPQEKLGHADVALKFIEEHEGFVYTEAQEKSVLRKIDRHLMPLMFISYVIQYMDKATLSQSVVYGLRADLGLKGQDYSWCSSLFYFGYLCFQPFAALLLTYFGMRMGKFVSITSMTWGIILICTAACTNFTGMAIARFVLGVAEGGISPSYVLLTASWYKKDEIPLRMTVWFCGNGVAIILQSVVSYGIGHINTGIPVWKWFYIIFGIIGLAWSVVLWFYMPDTMLTCNFLSEEEKVIAVERIRRNRTGVANPEFRKEQFIDALKDPKVWWSFFFTLVWIFPTTAVASFGSLVINGFGFTAFQSSLLNMPLGLTENIGLLTAGFVTARYPNTRCLMQFVTTLPAAIGSALIYTLPASNKVGRLVSFYCCNFTNAALPMLWALTTSNIAGHTKRTVSNAFMFMGYSAGLIIGPQFFLGSEAPTYHTGFQMMVVCFALATVLPGVYWLYITYLNRSNAKKLAESGEQNVIIRNEEFHDLTDKEQLHFVYIK